MKNLIYILIVFVFITIRLEAQESNAKQTLVGMPNESISLTLDRGMYIAGEKLWFSANCETYNADENNELSKVLYIDLYNSTKNSSLKRKFQLAEGRAYGSIDIPTDFSTDSYLIRAYTQYIKNFDPSLYETKLIQIVNPNSKLPALPSFKGDILGVSVEGEHLIEGLNTQLLLSVRPDYISKLNKIELYADAQMILEKSAINNGLELIEITPEIDVNYQFKLYTTEDTLSQDLPTVNQNALGLRSEWNSQGLEINIHNPSANRVAGEFIVYNKFLQVLSNNAIVINNEDYTELIPNQIIDNGLNHLVFKSNTGEILCKKSIYKGEMIDLNVTTNLNEYANREQVTVEIQSDNNDIKTVSAAIVKKGTAADKLSYTILHNPVLLKSYLKNQFLNEKDLSMALLAYANSALTQDLLKLDTEVEISTIPDIRDVSISGMVQNSNTKEPISNALVFLSVFKDDPQMHVIKTKEDGSFIFSVNNFENEREMFITVKADSLIEYEILVNNDFQNTYSNFNEIHHPFGFSDQSLIEEMYINTQANKLFETEAFGLEDSRPAIPFSFSTMTQVLDLTKYINSPDLQTVFRELVHNVKVRKRKGDFEISLYEFETSTRFNDPLVIVDNLPILDLNELMRIPPTMVDNISVIMDKYQVGDEAFNGVLILNTNTQNFGGMKFNPGSIFIEYQTIANPLKLSPIDYSLTKFKNQKLADFRNMLHWEADLSIENNTHFDFYTSDHDAEYEVIVKGITNDGNICYGKTSFKVK